MVDEEVCKSVNWCCEDCPKGAYYEDIKTDEDGYETKECYWTCKKQLEKS